MTAELVEIHPPVLKFTFELGKQSSCSIQLTNKTDKYVAFKVKTTCPKRYCVRPNTGILKPNSTCDFTVTMQAQRNSPPDLVSKDKFLVQSTVVPFGTTDEEITSEMFSKENIKYIEERKLKVSLASPPQSPLSNGELKQDSGDHETSSQNHRPLGGVQNIPPPSSKDMVGIEPATKLGTSWVVDGFKEYQRAANDVEELKPAKRMPERKPSDDVEELKSKLILMESKLKEAERSIMKLREERSSNTREKIKLKHEVDVLKRHFDARNSQVGFPFLFVCMVAIICLSVGYFSHC